MTGLIGCPPQHGKARTEWLYDAARNRGEFEFTTIKSGFNGHVAEFQVFRDALRVDGVRINVSAELQQRLANYFGCMLLTPKLADLTWQQRTITIPPFTRQITSSTQAMIEHSAQIDAALSKLGNPSGLIGTTGKHWTISNDIPSHPGKAENTGWYFAGPTFQGMKGSPSPTLPGVRLIQPPSWCHDSSHSDYSQTCVLISCACIVDGKSARLEEVLKDPKLAPLASRQGVMRLVRQP